MRERLSVYHRQTEPLVAYYRQRALGPFGKPRYARVDGVGDVAEVRARIVDALADHG